MVYPIINGYLTGDATEGTAPRFPIVMATNSSPSNCSNNASLVTTSKTVSKTVVLCLVLAACVASGGLGAGSGRPEEGANDAALAWLKLVDDGKPVESWQALAAASRESISQWALEARFYHRATQVWLFHGAQATLGRNHQQKPGRTERRVRAPGVRHDFLETRSHH